ncbi:hypothetical protein ACHHYP_02289 [Achlya hypogyna]|uniref:Uncharacterized protein n=1 Tax=Achlya hypogyna TaxID=1202772 RepID=A0A1V9Z6Z5_ACHHY|nr:hypothetical protein ACHHYP_02289 [Achlya hypogyna]
MDGKAVVSPSNKPDYAATSESHAALLIAVGIMHLLSVAYALMMAYAHYYLQHVSGGYNYIKVLRLYEPANVAVAVWFLIVGLHGLALLRMLYQIARRPVTTGPRLRASSCGSRLRRSLWRWVRLFGVNGPYYEVKLAIKHAVVATSQTYRAYSTSVLVGVSLINNAFSVLLFIYGVVVPVLWQFARSSSPTTRRKYTIAAAVMLNFVANVALPSWILRPYLNFFTRKDASKIQYEDTFYPIGVSVVQSVLVTSALDVFVVAVTHAFLLFALSDFVNTFILHRRPVLTRAQSRQGPLPRCFTDLAVLGYATSILWAIAVLALSCASLKQPSCERGCLAQTFPWLTGKCACTVLETTCDANGSLLLPEDGGIETRSLVFLIVSHCPRLVMPPALSRFTNLVGLEIYNSTIARWGEDASITAFSRFSYAILVRTNMSDLPLGLFHNAPTTFIDLEISETNLSSINLDAPLLQTLTVLYVEHAQLQEFPWQLADHQGLNELSLMGNNIAEIPANLSLPSLNYLQLSSNPLTAVPDAVFGLPNLWELYVDNSFVSSFPTDTGDFGGALSTIGAFNSTFCNSTDPPMRPLVTCTRDIYASGYFPTTQIIASRTSTNLLQR